MKVKSVSFYICLTFVSIFISGHSYSANRFWVSGGTGNWNSTTNWSNASGGTAGFSVPGISDVAIFDALSMSNCAINANASVNGFTISGLYVGIISVNPAITVTVAASGFSQAGGTFTGNNGNISINGAFSLTGGVFNSTTGTLQITSGYTFSAGTFNHNTGTVSFSTTQTITGNTSLHNIVFVSNGGVYTIASGTIITSANNVAISGVSGACVINTGTVEIKGDLTIATASNSSVNGGSATFLFNGTGVQNINSSIASIVVGTNERTGSLPNIEINKTSGSLNLNGVININGTSWITTAGASLVNPGTSTVNIISAVTFSGQNLSLYNIHIYANAQTITLNPATYTLTSTNNVTINGGSYYVVNTGILEILGDLTLTNTSTSAVNGGTGTFLFDGTGVQNINSAASSLNYVCALPNILINKSSGALNLTGILNFSGSSWNTVAGASLVNAGTSVVNLLKHTTLSGQNLSLYDLTISGNFSITTISSGLVWTSTHLLTLGGTTSWYQINTGTLNAKGDVLVTNINTSNNVGGNALLLFDGSANQTLTGSGVAGGGKLPQVQINKTGGTLTLSNSIISTDNSWTYIAGNVDASTNTSTVDFYKTSVIDGQGTSTVMAFHHVIVSGFISLGGNMDVNGDFTIRSGVNNRLDVTASNNYQLNIGGNWTNNNSVTTTSFNQQSGKVVFDGGAAQSLTLALATHTEPFYNLEMNNLSTGLALNAPITILNNINFISGNIISSASTSLLVGNAATSTGANNTSFVSGPVFKTGNQAFIFPVGRNAVYAPLAMSAPAVNTNQFKAEYFQTDPNALYPVTSKDISLNHISQCEYWILDRTVGSSNVTVRLSWDARSCGVTNLNDLRVAGWDGAQWKDHGNGGTTGTMTVGTVVSSAAITSFGPFTLSSTTTENPLPIELLSFTGYCDDDYAVLLNWRTASEINNHFFTIERASAAINWIIIATVDGAGNSSTTSDYSFIDPQRYNSTSYYRLKQTDFDGTSKYSEVIYVKNCLGDFKENDFIIYPNPTSGVFNILYTGDVDDVRSITIYNELRQRIYYSDAFQSIIDLSDKPSGLYFIYFNLRAKTIIKKIIIK